MEFFDSHAHYDDAKFDEDRNEVIQSIYQSNITKVMSAGYDVMSSEKGLKLAKENPFIYTTSGISPNDVNETWEETKEAIELIEKMILEEQRQSREQNRKTKIVGVGEIGLDYYWNKENKEIQRNAFIAQIEIANRLHLPIAIHSRDAEMDTLQILKEHPVEKKGVFHCCPLNRELVKEALKLGFYISLAGPVTFKNSKNAAEIVQMVPIDRMLIETDSPYLSPEPLRGKRNDSRNIKLIAQKIADFKGETIEKIANMTYQNAETLYNIF